MDFFGFPPEIRLQIYAELLVLSEPIVFAAPLVPSLPPLFRFKLEGASLCPALLRVNRRIYSEAILLLYSENRFQFPNIRPLRTSAPDILLDPDVAGVAPFLNQIGSQASLVRHICITYPALSYNYRQCRHVLHDAHLKNLELLRVTCTSLNTVDLSLSSITNALFINPSGGKLDRSKAFDLLDRQFKAIPSLQRFCIKFRVYGHQDLDHDMMNKVRNCGWNVEVIRVEI